MISITYLFLALLNTAIAGNPDCARLGEGNISVCAPQIFEQTTRTVEGVGGLRCISPGPVLHSESPAIVDQSLLCQDPAAILCNPDVFPLSQSVSNAQETLNTLNGRGGSAEQKFSRVFTSDRLTRAGFEFERAREAMTRFVQARFRTEINPSFARKYKYSGILDRIKMARLLPDRDTTPPVFNAAAVCYPFAGITQGICDMKLGGMITLVDTNPQALYFFLLHEFSHFFDGFEIELDANNPFTPDMLCLAGPNSVVVKQTDVPCLQRMRDNARNYTDDQLRGFGLDPAHRGDIVDALTECHAFMSKRNNRYYNHPNGGDCDLDDIDDDSTRTSFQSLLQASCNLNQGQLREVGADYLAAEAIAYSVGQSVGIAPAEEGIIVTESGNLVNLVERANTYPEVFKAVIGLCAEYHSHSIENEDEHPHASRRINHIFFANPVLNRFLGCPGGRVAPASQLANVTDVTPSQIGHCSRPQLHGF